MTKTKKTLLVILSVLLVACLGLFGLTACGSPVKSISATVTKTDYIVGEELDLAGLVVTATKEDKTTEELKAEDYTVSPAAGTKLTAENKQIEITYTKDETVKTTIKLNVHNKVADLKLKTATTATVWSGEETDFAGLVLEATYEDGSKEDVTVDKATVDKKVFETDTDKEMDAVFTYGGKSVTVKIPVKENPVVSMGNLLSQPRTEYIANEAFSPAGATVEISYKSGRKATVELTDANTTYEKTPIAFGTDTEKEVSFTVTYSATVTKEFKVTAQLVKGIYLEAEDGLLNGKPMAVNENNSGNIYMDAVMDSNNPEAHGDYGEWKDSYLATGGGYVGNVTTGSTISVTFTSDKAGKGSVVLRMASQLLLKETASWAPSQMGDVQLNKICEVKVNGKVITLSDAVILPGGGDGETLNRYLWMNWKDVALPNVDLVAGENTIEVFFPERADDPETTEFNEQTMGHAEGSTTWTANFDSIIVASATCKLSKIGDINGITTTGATVTVDQGAKSGKLVISGTVDAGNIPAADVAGMIEEGLLITVGTTKVEAEVSYNRGDATFEAVVDLANFGTGTYTIYCDYTIANAPALKVAIATVEKTATYADYKLSASEENATVTLEVTKTAKIESYVATAAELKKEGDVPYFVITGTIKYAKYEAEDLSAALAQFMKFDLQDVTGNTRVLNTADNWTITVADASNGTATFTMKVDISTLLGVTKDKVTVASHIGDYATKNEAGDKTVDGKAFGTLSNFDYLAASAVKTGADNAITAGRFTYTLSYEPNYSTRNNADIAGDAHKQERVDHAFGTVGIVVVNNSKAEYTLTNANGVKLEKTDDDKVLYVLEGTSKNLNAEELKSLIALDFENSNGGGRLPVALDKITVTVTPATEAGAADTFVYKADVTDVELGTYWAHANSADKNGNVNNSKGTEAITIGAKKYSYREITFSWGKSFLFAVDDARVLTVSNVTLKDVNGKAVITITGTSSIAEQELALETVLGADPWTTEKRTITVTWDGTNFTATFDVTDLPVGKAFWIHFDYKGGTKDLPTTFKEGDADTEITIGDVTYKLTPAGAPENSPQIVISQKAAATPAE